MGRYYVDIYDNGFDKPPTQSDVLIDADNIPMNLGVGDPILIDGQENVGNKLILPYVKLTSKVVGQPNWWNFTEAIWDNTNLVFTLLTETPLTGTCYSLIPLAGRVNSYHQLYKSNFIINSSRLAIYYFIDQSQPNGLFAVKITVAAGANGTNTTKPTYTYNVTSVSGDTIGSAVAVTRPRSNGKVVTQAAGSYGLGFYDENGNFKLWDAGEVPDTYSCP